MRRAAAFIVAFAVTVLALGTSLAMQSEPWTMGGASSANCGCPIIQSVRVTPASTIEPQVNYTLVGNAVSGWGFSNATITQPGPNITVYLGDVVTLTLIGNDSNTPHNWFIDYNNDGQPSPGEPSSPDFNAPGGPKVRVWNFTADRPGQYTYRCLYHPTSMTGTIIILGEERRPPGGPAVGLIPGILLISLGGVLVISVIYHVRAVRAAKRRR